MHVAYEEPADTQPRGQNPLFHRRALVLLTWLQSLLRRAGGRTAAQAPRASQELGSEETTRHTTALW